MSANIWVLAARLLATELGAEQYTVNAEIVRHYLMKGVAEEVRQTLGLGRFPGEHGAGNFKTPKRVAQFSEAIARASAIIARVAHPAQPHEGQ